MSLHFLILQAVPNNDPAGGLSEANNIAIGVFSVGMIVILLLLVHYYQRKGMVERKTRRKSYGEKVEDPILQMPYMSREELKEMVLREKEKKQAERVKKLQEEQDKRKELPQAAPPKPTMLFPAMQAASHSLVNLNPESKDQTGETDQGKLPPQLAMYEEILKGNPVTGADVISKVVMSAEIEKAKAEAESEELVEPKRGKMSNVERSMLSNETPDDFKKRSRKI